MCPRVGIPLKYKPQVRAEDPIDRIGDRHKPPVFGVIMRVRCAMSTKVLMDVEEYLRTSFGGPDCEYLEGEIVERNMGELPHGDLQANLTRLLWPLRSRLGIRIVTEIRIQIHPRRYRVVDIA